MIDLQQLVQALAHDEGLRLEAYPDPLTKSDPWTIGYGHTGKNVHRGLVITQAQAMSLLLADIRSVTTTLPTWTSMLDAVRYNVVANMAFNMGVGKLVSGWPHTMQQIRDGKYAQAAAGMETSLWAKEVGSRAKRLAAEMETGAFQPLT